MNLQEHIEEKVDQFIGQGFSSPEAVKNWLRKALTSTITKMLEADIERLRERKKPMYHDECVNAQAEICDRCMSGQIYNAAIEAELTLKQQQLDELTKEL